MALDLQKLSQRATPPTGEAPDAEPFRTEIAQLKADLAKALQQVERLNIHLRERTDENIRQARATDDLQRKIAELTLQLDSAGIARAPTSDLNHDPSGDSTSDADALLNDAVVLENNALRGLFDALLPKLALMAKANPRDPKHARTIVSAAGVLKQTIESVMAPRAISSDRAPNESVSGGLAQDADEPVADRSTIKSSE